MYCKNCGAKISDNARFCPKCGTELKKINSGNASDKKVVDNHSAAENRTIPVKYLIAGAVFVLAIICIVVVIAVKHNGNDAENNVESIAEISADNYEYTEIEANADNSDPA
ncbi:MAG: zinc-ribbon domain-containing protein, partial [Butyrivibrio sp.]|nr:zinc-ribbon domain-containing protein [Butyrivibrio sp.]